MNNARLRLEIKVGLDKVDSSAYPEIYDEQIDIAIDDAINEFTRAARTTFEETQQLTDDVKALVPAPMDRPVEKRYGNEYIAYVPSNYLYLLKARGYTTIQGKEVIADMRFTQLDDIERVLSDPFNKPTPNSLPYTMEKDALVVYGSDEFEVTKIRITFMRKPNKVSEGQEIDLDEHVHKLIAKRAVEILLENIESIRSRK